MSQLTQDILFKLGVTAAAQRHDMHMQVISITISQLCHSQVDQGNYWGRCSAAKLHEEEERPDR